jgi:hypothetical protein
LALQLSASEEIVLGMERYGHLYHPQRFMMAPSLFEKERFLDVRPGDTFYESLDYFAGHYASQQQKIDTCRYIGDKRPDLYLSYHQLIHRFPEAIIFYIFRDVFEVASSYNLRAQEGSSLWPLTWNYKKAVREWNQSLWLTLRAHQKGLPIHCVEYKDVLNPKAHQQRLFEVLGVAYKEQAAQGVQQILNEEQEHAAHRTLHLSDEEVRYIEMMADFALFEQMKTLKLKLS